MPFIFLRSISAELLLGADAKRLRAADCCPQLAQFTTDVRKNLAVCGFFRNFAVLKKALRKAFTMEITIQIY